MQQKALVKAIAACVCSVVLTGCFTAANEAQNSDSDSDTRPGVEQNENLSGEPSDDMANEDNQSQDMPDDSGSGSDESETGNNTETPPNGDEPEAEDRPNEDALTKAIRTGNPAFLPVQTADIEQGILDEIQAAQEGHVAFMEAVYGNQSVAYQPGRGSSLVFAEGLAGAYPLVVGNGGKTLALANEQDGTRNAAFGSNILRSLQEGNHQGYSDSMRSVLRWLTGNESQPAAADAKVVFTLIDNTSFNRSRDWILAQFPEWDVSLCHDLNACALEGADLLVTGSRQDDKSLSDINTLFSEAETLGVSKLYVHLHSWNTSALTNTVVDYFGFSMPSPGSAGNYWSQDAASWNSYIDMMASASNLGKTEALIERLQSGQFDMDLSQCVHTSSGYNIDCSATSYDSEFAAVANTIKQIINKFDQAGRDIFSEENLKLEKLLILLGDAYRKQVSFPMDKDASETVDFLKALYADSTVYNVRQYNPVQPDMGNFSRSDFSHITPVTKVLSYTSKPNFRSAGVYALPGQTFKVTRLDSSELSTKIFVNSVRHQSTQQFSRNGYKRPKYLRSAAVEVKPGETIYMTSPYGGPIQVSYSQNELPVSLRFERVGEHAYWDGPEDNARFDAALARGDFDWAEVVTPGFEVHSTLQKMRTTVSNPNWNTGAKLAEATTQYLHNYPHVLAGFKGPGLDVVPEIHDFATTLGGEVPHIDIVKHMNADQPSCGGGCSGNPYDAGWAFSPTGHGDIHELGHGLEKGRMKFEGREGHATTNYYSYFSKSQFEDETGNPASCQNLPFENMFNHLKASWTSNDPYAYMQSKSGDMNKWNYGVGLMLQAMMGAQEQSTELSDGWYVIPRLHLLNREFDLAKRSEETWQAKKDQLGFSNFNRSQANMMQNNDFLLIGLGLATQLDYREFFDMWGLRLSDLAKQQVAAEGYRSMPKKVYAPETSNSYCSSLDVESFTMSASANWPHN